MSDDSTTAPEMDGWSLRSLLRYWLALCVMTRLGRPGSWAACRLIYRYHPDGTRTVR